MKYIHTHWSTVLQSCFADVDFRLHAYYMPQSCMPTFMMRKFMGYITIIARLFNNQVTCGLRPEKKRNQTGSRLRESTLTSGEI